MALQTALFFESVEQIYARIFQVIKPRTSVPIIRVQFCAYANANSRIKLCNGILTVRISDLLRPAPAPVQEALASILISKLFRKPADGAYAALYQRYLNRTDVQGRLHLVRQQRGRKAMEPPRGDQYNLDDVFTDLNAKYFDGILKRPSLGWSKRLSRTILGHYDPSHHAIVISKLLDSPFVPQLVVEYVMYHEMLHIQHPTKQQGERRRIHTAEFRHSEKQFEGYADARKALKALASASRPD